MAWKIGKIEAGLFEAELGRAMGLAGAGDHAGARGIFLTLLEEAGQGLPRRHMITAEVALALGCSENAMGYLAEAASRLLYALEVFDGHPYPYDMCALIARYELGLCLRRQGRMKAAAGHLCLAFPGIHNTRGPGDPKTLVCVFEMAHCFIGLGALRPAVLLLEMAVEMCMTHLGAGDATTVMAELLLGEARKKESDALRAEAPRPEGG